jgi:hypothetical protein
MRISLLDIVLLQNSMQKILENKQAPDFDRQRAFRLFNDFLALPAEFEYELEPTKERTLIYAEGRTYP